MNEICLCLLIFDRDFSSLAFRRLFVSSFVCFIAQEGLQKDLNEEMDQITVAAWDVARKHTPQHCRITFVMPDWTGE